MCQVQPTPCLPLIHQIIPLTNLVLQSDVRPGHNTAANWRPQVPGTVQGIKVLLVIIRYHRPLKQSLAIKSIGWNLAERNHGTWPIKNWQWCRKTDEATCCILPQLDLDIDGTTAE